MDNMEINIMSSDMFKVMCENFNYAGVYFRAPTDKEDEEILDKYPGCRGRWILDSLDGKSVYVFITYTKKKYMKKFNVNKFI
jgi:hypothetical protein